MRYANIYIYIFVLHRGFFQQPRDRVAPGKDALPLMSMYIIDYQRFQNRGGNFVHIKFTLLSCCHYKLKKNLSFFSLVFICLKKKFIALHSK